MTENALQKAYGMGRDDEAASLPMRKFDEADLADWAPGTAVGFMRMEQARADADYCNGCDLPLTKCLAHHGRTGSKCCPECKHPAEANAFADLRAEVAELRAQLREARRINTLQGRDAALAEVAALVEVLADVVGQACYVDAVDGVPHHLDSMALSAYASGMRALAERGRITIEHEYGRRVIGTWREA